MADVTGSAGPLHGTTLIIVLPRGLEPGGVTTWALRTRDAVTGRGGVCQIVWPDPDPPVLDGLVSAVRACVETSRAQGVGRVLLAPQLSGEAYAASCIVAAGDDRTGVVGWMHTDIRYDTELIRRFAPALSRVFCVSRPVADHLAREAACGPDLTRVVRTGVPFGAAPVAVGPAHDPLRLLYVGRLDAFQKRVFATIGVVRELRRRGVACMLTIVGDGPSAERIRSEAVEAGGVALLGEVANDKIPEVCAEHDLLLMPSRSEGLGLARIEAAQQGCVPVVTPGGGADGVTHGVDGIVVDCPPGAGDGEAAVRFADAVVPYIQSGIAPMRERCVQSARARFSMETYADRLSLELGALVDPPEAVLARAELARDPARAAAFTVPEGFRESLVKAAGDLAGRGVVLHGAGAHTNAIWGALGGIGVSVVAVADDDPERWGGELHGVPVIDPADAAGRGAGHVLISSWLHEDAVWARRGVYEEAGLEVRRIYGAVRAAQPAGL